MRDVKYPLFALGLFIMIVGGVSEQHLGATLDVEVATVVAGFILLFLGIVLE